MTRTVWRDARKRGFTLVEILVALAVVGMGATIFISVFSSALDLARSSRSKTAAASIAEEQLDAIVRHPGQYRCALNGAKAGDQLPIVPRGTEGDKPRGVAPPSVMPADAVASRREMNFYERFRWQAYAKAPAAESPFVEVTVAVRWKEAGRDQTLALTTSAHRTLFAAKAAKARPGAGR